MKVKTPMPAGRTCSGRVRGVNAVGGTTLGLATLVAGIALISIPVLLGIVVGREFAPAAAGSAAPNRYGVANLPDRRSNREFLFAIAQRTPRMIGKYTGPWSNKGLPPPDGGRATGSDQISPDRMIILLGGPSGLGAHGRPESGTSEGVASSEPLVPAVAAAGTSAALVRASARLPGEQRVLTFLYVVNGLLVITALFGPRILDRRDRARSTPDAPADPGRPTQGPSPLSTLLTRHGTVTGADVSSPPSQGSRMRSAPVPTDSSATAASAASPPPDIGGLVARAETAATSTADKDQIHIPRLLLLPAWQPVGAGTRGAAGPQPPRGIPSTPPSAVGPTSARLPQGIE